MILKLQDKDIEQIVEKRRDFSYYNITADWYNGFIEAEGSFFETRGGFPFFQCTQHVADCALLCAVRGFIGKGKSSKSVRDDGRSLAIYTHRGKSSCIDALLPLLRDPVLTNKSKRQLFPLAGEALTKL